MTIRDYQLMALWLGLGMLLAGTLFLPWYVYQSVPETGYQILGGPSYFWIYLYPDLLRDIGWNITDLMHFFFTDFRYTLQATHSVLALFVVSMFISYTYSASRNAGTPESKGMGTLLILWSIIWGIYPIKLAIEFLLLPEPGDMFNVYMGLGAEAMILGFILLITGGILTIVQPDSNNHQEDNALTSSEPAPPTPGSS